MDSLDHDDRLLAAFLAGDLDSEAARRWDEHLLVCERCWRAVREDRIGRQAAQILRQPAPAGLADRVAFAVEVAAAARAGAQRQSGPAVRSPRPSRHGRRSGKRLAGAGIIVTASGAVALGMLMLPGTRHAGSTPAVVAAVARYAQAKVPVRSLPSQGTGPSEPVEVGRPVTVRAGGQRIVLRTWRLGRTEAVVAMSSRPFPMPGGAKRVSGSGMAWSARLGRLGLYCLNGRTSELVAARLPSAELAALAARLPLA